MSCRSGAKFTAMNLRDLLLAALLLFTLLLSAEGNVGAALGIRQQRLAPLTDGLTVPANDQAATELLVNLCTLKSERHSSSYKTVYR